MTDASKPMSAWEFAEHIYNVFTRPSRPNPVKLLLIKSLDERDAAIRREAMAEAFDRAKHLVISAGFRSDIWNVEWLAGQISALSPDPTWRERIEAQARLDEHKIACPICCVSAGMHKNNLCIRGAELAEGKS